MGAPARISSTATPASTPDRWRRARTSSAFFSAALTGGNYSARSADFEVGNDKIQLLAEDAFAGIGAKGDAGRRQVLSCRRACREGEERHLRRRNHFVSTAPMTVESLDAVRWSLAAFGNGAKLDNKDFLIA